MDMRKRLPVLQWLPKYQGQTFRRDLVAGLTVGIMLVPQGMAYALLAGMPPIYGLYGSLLPMVLYGLLGTSRQLSIGAVAVPALLILAGVSALAEPFSERYVELVLITGLLVGVMQVMMGFLRLGVLVNFLSHPVILGFTSAAGVIIAVSQLKYLLGIPIPRCTHLHETVSYACMHLWEIHWPSFLICAGGIFIILGLRTINRNIPGALIITILGIALVAIFRLDQVGVGIVGKVPTGLPEFRIPSFTWDTVVALLPTVISVNIIGFVGSIGIAKLLEVKNKDTKVQANQELFALGIAKIGGAFFQAFPASGSFTRSLISNEAGAKTGMASILTAALIALTLLFLTPLFYYLPESILAAIVLVAVKGLFNVEEARKLWKVHRQDFFIMLTTFVSTLILGIVPGVLMGVGLSLAMIIMRASKAHVAVLGRLPNTASYKSVKRFKEAIQKEGTLVFRFDAMLFFGNVNYFKDTVNELLDEHRPRVFIFDASCMEDIDTSGLLAMNDLVDYLHRNDIVFRIAGAIGPVRDLMFKDGLMEKIGKENHFITLFDADNCDDKTKNAMADPISANAIQTNIDKK